MLIERSGTGPNLILLHGWAMSRHCWHHLTPLFEKHYKTVRVDLPGHGDGCGSSLSFTRKDELIAELSNLCEDGATWLGWSLGGLLAQMVAQAYPDKVKRLVCISSAACYVQKDDWPYGIREADFNHFLKVFNADSSIALENFLLMQVEGTQYAKETLRMLKLMSAKDYDFEELVAALQLLRTEDMRKALPEYKCPTLFVGGEADKLMPLKNLEESSKLVSFPRIYTMEAAGHAPMVSHVEDFIDGLSEFLERTDADK